MNLLFILKNEVSGSYLKIMISFWVILFIIVVFVSLVLAYRSMKGYQDVSISSLPAGLFLIRNPQFLTPQVVVKIYALSLESYAILSFERLLRGGEKALVIYGPKVLQSRFPELNLLELEEYLSLDQSLSQPKKIGVNDTIAWVLKFKDNVKGASITNTFLKDFTIGENQSFFLQIVSLAIKEINKFQVTLRVIASDKDPNFRTSLAKKINQLIDEKSDLIQMERTETTSKVFSDFQKRALVPAEVSKFTLTSDEIITLLT